MCAFRCLKGFRPEVFYSLSEEFLLSHKLFYYKRDPFLTMFYTIDSSPSLVTKQFIVCANDDFEWFQVSGFRFIFPYHLYMYNIRGK